MKAKKLKYVIPAIVLTIFSVLFIILSIITFIVIILSDFDFNKIPEKYESIYQTADNFEESFSEIRTRDEIVNQLIDINNKFHNNSKFDFVEMTANYIYTNTDKNKQEKLNALYCGEGLFELFELKTESNIYFGKDDFKFDGEIPVILGNNLKNKYSAGDTIELIRMDLYPIKCKIIDFLESNQTVIHFGQIINIDDVICIPFPADFNQQSDDPEIKEYQLRLMITRNNGIIIPKTSEKEIKNEINSYTDEYQLPPYLYSASVNFDKKFCLILVSVTVLSLIIGITLLIIGIKKFRKIKKLQKSTALN